MRVGLGSMKDGSTPTLVRSASGGGDTTTLTVDRITEDAAGRQWAAVEVCTSACGLVAVPARATWREGTQLKQEKREEVLHSTLFFRTLNKRLLQAEQRTDI